MWFYICVCMFFFFKPKTAYELRISDWSSDVCSSDLLDVGAAPGHVGRDRDPALAARLGDDMRFPIVISGVQHGMLDVARGEELGQKFRLQIGRASCRERGCQSV